jgi:HPt (histidine-containing phosphotransfer) domain-containing protein
MMKTKTIPALNIELLDETCDLDPEGLGDLITMYLNQADELIEQLQSAVQLSNAEEIERIAHKLAGASAVCGVSSLVAPLRVLEQRGRDNRLTEAVELLDSVVGQLEVCRKLLFEYLKRKNEEAAKMR